MKEVKKEQTPKKGTIEDANYLRDIRLALEMSQRDFAEATEISYSTIANIESQKYPMSPYVRTRITRYYNELHTPRSLEKILSKYFSRYRLPEELVHSLSSYIDRIFIQPEEDEFNQSYYQWLNSLLYLLTTLCADKSYALRKGEPIVYSEEHKHIIDNLKILDEYNQGKSSDPIFRPKK